MQAVSIHRFSASALCILTGSVVLGCGKGEYDSRMSGAAAAIARRAASGPQELAATHSAVRNNAGPQGLKVRFPTLFTAQTTSLDASQPRAKLMQVDLPGFCYTMERPLTDDAGKNIPAYCYLYSVPQAEADALHNQIQQAALGGATWVDNPPAGNIAVKMLKSVGDMDFDINGAVERLPAQVEVYSFAAGANRVVIGWRAATSVATKHKLFEAVRSSMNSAQLDAPAAAAPAPAAPAAGS
jgi:hypothetical protein